MRRPMRLSLFASLALAGAAPATAQALRDYCPERPGLDTPACTLDRGHVSVETGLVDWTREHDPDARTDTILFGDTLVRYGVSDRFEVQLGWTPAGHVRERDRASGEVMRTTQTGDVTLGTKLNLAHPDQSGVAVALLPEVSLPVGRAPVGAGTWGAGLRVPLSVQLADGLYLDATPEIDATPDEDGHGRHLTYGSAGGVQVELVKAVTLSVEGAVLRDRDPETRATLALASASFTWQPQDDLQLDAGAVAGLNHASPGIELYVGVSRRF